MLLTQGFSGLGGSGLGLRGYGAGVGGGRHDYVTTDGLRRVV